MVHESMILLQNRERERKYQVEKSRVLNFYMPRSNKIPTLNKYLFCNIPDRPILYTVNNLKFDLILFCSQMK